MAQYKLTASRRRALRRAQQISAKRRFGTHKHEITHFIKKGINKGSKSLTLGASGKVANFAELVQSAKKKR